MAASAAERMRSVRLRRCAQGKREIRLILPDARSEEVCARIAEAVARLNRAHEEESLRWVESVSEFDGTEAR